MDMAGNPSSVDHAIRIVAERLLEGVNSPPTDLDPIRRRLNIHTVDSEDLPFSGELRKDSGGFRIVCSNHLSSTRKRFTIAHEMAHAVFETTGARCPRVGKELERICDRLASELLMPQDLFVKSVGSHLSMERIFKLAGMFNTSVSATAIRCTELFGVSAFGTEGKIVSWGKGIIKRGSLESDDELTKIITRACSGESGQEVLYMQSRTWTGDWKIEWAPTGSAKAVFLLQPHQTIRKSAV